MEKHCSNSVYKVLEALGIPYKSLSHEPVETMEDCESIGEKLGAPFCKNLFLQNRQGTECFLLLIGKDKKFRTADVSKKIGKARLSFGSSDKLSELLGEYPGAISPMGLIHDKDRAVQLLIDRDLLDLERFCVHPCVNTESIIIGTRNFLDVFLNHTGHNPQIIEIEEQIMQEIEKGSDN